MPANPWELRADVRPLELAATRWSEIGAVVARGGDELVEAARRATEGWDAAAAESYEQHHRQVLVNLDRFTSLAAEVAGSLRAIATILTSSQEELDRAWTKVAMVPHSVVGESRHLVFTPGDDEGRGKVDQGRAETEEIRQRLASSLDQESARLRSARAELATVRTELTTLTAGTFGRLTGPGTVPAFGSGGEESGVGTFLPPSTSVPGSAQSGMAAAAGLPPVAPISVSVPQVTGLSAAALTPFVAGAAGGLTGRGSGRRTSGSAPPPAGGMAAGAMGARAGTMSSGMASGRAGARRLAAPRVDDEDGATTASRKAAHEKAQKEADKEAQKEAKRAALEAKRVERAARRAERERGKGEQEHDAAESADADATPDAAARSDGAGEQGERPAAITVVHYSPGEEPEEPRR